MEPFVMAVIKHYTSAVKLTNIVHDLHPTLLACSIISKFYFIILLSSAVFLVSPE